MNAFGPADELHRLVKEAIDSGAASSVEEAIFLFRRFQIAVEIGEAEANDPHHQAALLTAIALARRVFLGGVWVSGALRAPHRTPLPLGPTLQAAAVALGGQIGSRTGVPRITIGGRSTSRASEFHVRTAFAGWRGGIIPSDVDVVPARALATMALAPMLASALAVNEAFQFVRTRNGAAGRRPTGLSLWNPSRDVDWLADTEEPQLRFLPARLWLIGLGHLGQAYLWALGLLPYPDPGALSLVLQDVDVITPSTESTSILTTRELVGKKKTRAMATWAASRGFSNAIIERLFAKDFRRQPEEPTVALCGLDNALGRQALDQVGFDFVVEAGLGRGYRDFRSIRLHTLPGPKPASQLWAAPDSDEDVSGSPAYRKILREGSLDQCGVTLLSGKAVGAPFVGAVAACLVVSEVLRLLEGGTIHQVIDFDLQAIDYRSAVPHTHSLLGLNPGYVLAAEPRPRIQPCGQINLNSDCFDSRGVHFIDSRQAQGETHA